MNPHEVRQTPAGDLVVRFDQVKSGWEQWFLLSSDRHWDNPKSDRAMQKRHLDQAVERDALIIDIGDLYCAMQGAKDRRGSKSDLRPEHQTTDYFSALHRTAVDWFRPYAPNWLLMGTGNHETAILKHNEIDLTGDLVAALNAHAGSSIYRGNFAGWIKFQFGPDARKSWPAINLFYHHGYGGGGPVTRGVIQTARRAVYLPDAHAVITGHIHERWLVPIPRERISDQGITYMDEQEHVQIPSYKDEWGGKKKGWHVERGGPPKPLGAVWMRLWYERQAVHMEFTRAQ